MQKKTVKQPRKSKKPIPEPQNIARLSDTESRSKSAVSEFHLVIEKEKSRLPPVELSGLFRSLKRNSRHSSTIEDNFQSDNQEVVELDGGYENESSIQLNNDDNMSCVSGNLAADRSLNKSSNTKQNCRPTASRVSPIEPEVLSKSKRNMKNPNVSHKNKNSKEVVTSKKRLANSTISKPVAKKSRNIEHSIRNDISSKKRKTSIHQESERNVLESVANTVSNDNQNYQIALETVVKVSPFKRNIAVASKRWISPNKIFEIPEEQPNMENMNTLTEMSCK